MSRFPGNIIKLPNVTPTQNSASGVWSLKDQLVYQRNNLWPFQRDPYFNYTTLLLQGNVPYTTGPQAMTLPLSYNADASTNNFLVTPNGDVGPKPFSPYFGGNYSVYFNGSNQYLSVASNAAFGFGTGDATIECWFYAENAATGSTQVLLDLRASAGATPFACGINPTGFPFLYNGSPTYISSIAVSSAIWNHIAIVRNGSGTNNCKIYVNGIQGIQFTDTSDWGSAKPCTIASNVSGTTEFFKGYISNVRLVKGTAVYTTNFTPPTQPLQNIPNTSLLTCQSNRFIDNSSNNFTITRNGDSRITDNSPFVSTDFTTGAGYFDGNGDTLSIGAASNWTFLHNGSDFTIQFWIYPTLTNVNVLADGYDSTVSHGFIIDLGAATAGQLRYLFLNASGSAAAFSSNASVVTLNQWNYCAFTFTSSTKTGVWYVNGASAGSTTNTGFSYSSTAPAYPLIVADRPAGVAPEYQGYISNLHITNSVVANAVSIPTALLTPVTGTQLLTLQTRAASQNIGFIDSSPNEFIVTKNGNTTQGTFSPFSPTGWGTYGSGTTSYAQLNNADYAISTGDFTIEFWMYLTSDKATTCFCSATSNPNLTVAMTGGSSGARLFYMEYGGTGTTFGAGSNYLNKWTHVAFVRSSGVVTCYQDGNATNPGGTTKSAAVGSTANLYLLRNSGDTSQDIPGYVSNFRICKSAVYGANFNPSTSALTTTSQNATNCVLLTFQNNRFRDNSSNNSTVTPSANLSVQAFSPFAPATQSSPLVTGGSGYFDGGASSSNDYLTVPDSPVFTLGTSDFTIEAWVYSTLGTGADRYIAAQTDNSTATGSAFALYTRSADAFILFEYYSSSTTASITSGAAITLNQWNHIVVCRSGGTLSMFVNGVRPAAGTTSIGSTSINDSAASFSVGARSNGNNAITGYIAASRFVRGADIYGASNTNIVVPTTPPTAIPNTSLLLNFTNGAAVDASGKNVVESIGTVQTSNTQAKWNLLQGGSSVYVNGDGNYLKMPCTPINALNGDFTLEAWVYPIDAGRSADAEKYGTIISIGSTGVSSPELSWFVRIVGGVITEYFININSTTVLQVTGLSVSLNAWHYFAVVRSGTATGNVKLYIDGSLVGTSSSANTSAMNFTSTQALLIARNANSASYQNWLKGYFQNIRVSNYARTVTSLPTGPFPIG